jgi:predicted Rossmann fold flavoprotein
LKIYDIAILGCGASCLAFVNFIDNKNIAIIDANHIIAPKMKISGGGRCNITNKNVSKTNYLGDQKFIESILNGFSNKDLINFLKSKNIDTSLENKIVNGQYFGKKSTDIIDKLSINIDQKSLFLNYKIIDVKKTIIKEEEYFEIITSKKSFISKKLIVATGGLSYSTLNASDIGFKIAQDFGHKINNLNPALVGFTVQKEQFWFKKLSGISVYCKVCVNNKNFLGNILFTHKGCSGPVILNSSLYWSKGNISIDFLPNVDLESLLTNSNKKISTIIPIAKRFLQEFLLAIDVEDKPISKLIQKDKDKLFLLKNYIFSPAGNFGYTKAEVTKGGVETSQINPNTMESLLQKNLYFIGEVLDITGELGGYNFQFAFSSAKVCASSINT